MNDLFKSQQDYVNIAQAQINACPQHCIIKPSVPVGIGRFAIYCELAKNNPDKRFCVMTADWAWKFANKEVMKRKITNLSVRIFPYDYTPFDIIIIDR